MSLLFANTAGGADIYISPDGDDGNPGSESMPLQTLEAARDAVRGLRKNTPITIRLLGGVYEMEHSLELDERDSGTEGNRVVYRAAEGEEVRLAGGREIPVSAFQPLGNDPMRARIPRAAQDHVYQVNLKALGIADFGEMVPRGFGRPVTPAPLELVYNDELMQLARWPNDGYARYGMVIDPGTGGEPGDEPARGGAFLFEDERPTRWAGVEDVWVSGYWAYHWADDTLPVQSIDVERRRITLGEPHTYTLKPTPSSPIRLERPYFALNLLEELDRPGEYYIDRATGLLYFWPPSPLEKGRAVVTLLEEPLIVMEGVSHVTVQGITLEATRGPGIYMTGGAHNRIAGCTIRNIGTAGICIGEGVDGRRIGNVPGAVYADTGWNRNAGHGHGIVSCDIHHTGATGVILGGGDRQTLRAGGNYILNCDIHHAGRIYRQYQPPVYVDGVGNRIAHNRLHHSPHCAIWFYGNDHLIEFNEIAHCVFDSDDAGAIESGRDPTMQGIVIRHNYFHHNGGRRWTEDIFFDDGLSGEAVYGNVFFRPGPNGALFIHGGQFHRFEHNIVIDGKEAVRQTMWDNDRWAKWLQSPLIRKRMFEAVDSARPPYSERYPNLKRILAAEYARENNLVKGNLLYRTWGGISDGGPEEIGNFMTDEDPGFVDLERMNFALKEDSIVYNRIPNFQPIPFERIGLYADEYRSSLPEEQKSR